VKADRAGRPAAAMHSSPTPWSAKDFERYFFEQVAAAAHAVLSLLESEVRPGEQVGEALAVDSAGVVGFADPQMRGSISVAIACSELDGMREDCASEIANQIVGRVKNKLGRVGFRYDIAPPVTLRGRQISITSRSNERRIRFGGSRQTYFVHAALDVLGEAVIPEPGTPGDEPLDEGGLILF
jgi:hypothetical protein